MVGLRFLVVLVNLSFGTFVLGISNENIDDIPNYRLSADVFPLTYIVKITPYLNEGDENKRFTFDGEVFIDIKPKEINEIVLHSKNLNYSLMQYWDKNKPYEISNFENSTIDNITDKFYLQLNENLDADNVYTLHFIYVGNITDEMYGFYRRSYVDDKNNTKWAAYTFFEPNFARRVFPCFDEPKFKATFNLTIIRHKNFKSVSNTRMISSKNISENMYADIYSETPIMSTYLLAFLVSEDFNEHGNETLLVVARPELNSLAKYISEIGTKILNEFNKYTEIPYRNMGIDKIHIEVVPDSKAQGMENWGLIILQEYYILSNLGISAAKQQEISKLISYELAHMWFGNLVTCEWWSYLWLNEGFAAYFAYMMTGKAFPEWNLDDQFVHDEMRHSFDFDSSKWRSPLNDKDVLKPSDAQAGIRGIFTYNKANCFIRMIQHAMGEEEFHQSLKEYLTEFKYKTVLPENLLNHWKNHWPNAFKNYTEGVFKSFTDQAGYPVVLVNVSSDGKTMELSQKQFLSDPKEEKNNTIFYTIPFSFTTSKDPDFETTSPKLYLESNSNITKVSLPGVDWVFANIQRSGYYRVNYDSQTWLNIKNALMASNWSNIHPLNRAQYVDDLIALSWAGEVERNLTIECLKYLETETESLPWAAAIAFYKRETKHMKPLEKEIFLIPIAKLAEKIFEVLGFEEKQNDTALDTSNREYIRLWSCINGNILCFNEAKKYFDAMNATAVPDDIRSLVYCTVIRMGTEVQFNQLYQKYKIETNRYEKIVILMNLGCLKDENMMKKYFEIIMSNEFESSERHLAITFLTFNYVQNAASVFNLLTENFERLANLDSYTAVAKFFASTAMYLDSESLKKFEDFYEQNMHKFGESAFILQESLNATKYNFEIVNELAELV